MIGTKARKMEVYNPRRKDLLMKLTGVRGAGRARTQDLSVRPLSTRSVGAFGTSPPLRIVYICRVVFPGPECVPDRPVAGDGHVGSQF